MTDSFGAELKKYRIHLGLSLDDVAKRAGMSKGGVWEVEKGRSDPRLSTMRKLSRAVGVSISDLLSEANQVTLSRIERRIVDAYRKGVEMEGE